VEHLAIRPELFRANHGVQRSIHLGRGGRGGGRRGERGNFPGKKRGVRFKMR